VSFKDHFSERAAGYAARRPHYPPELAAWLAGVAPAQRSAWDAACGSGQLSTSLATHFEKVIATDASAAQIEQAAAHPRVEYRVEAAEETAISSDSMDLVTLAQAAHWIDLGAFYSESRRVARPSAVVALIAYGKTQVEPAIDVVIEDFYGGELEAYWPPERKHIENGYRDLPFPFSRIDAPNFEMCHRWSAEDLIGYIRTWSAVRAMEKKSGAVSTERFADRLRTAWGAGIRDVRWPLTIIAGVVR
jgi:ubiquinone/menaquinone biosynthesis C-methylase UbiE